MSPFEKFSRRDFARLGGAGAAALLAPRLASPAAASPRLGRIVPTDRKLNIACIGCGGKGESDIKAVSEENIVALCDVDDVRAARTYRLFPNARRYRDYRQMLVDLDDQIDAVVVSTPDHTHFPAGMMAISMGKHVYIQKPIALTVWEARELTLAARRHQVVTQMGNQGHAGEGTRLVREWAQAGAVGAIREVHLWTPKMELGPFKSATKSRPAAAAEVPATLDWNGWLGTAPVRPYSDEYHPQRWRNWWDFGSGALGDIGCHLMDASFYALDLGAPEAVEAESADFTAETCPDWSIVTYYYPARGAMPPVKVVWHDGGKQPPRPRDLEPERALSRVGQVLIGENGSILETGEKCGSPRVVPETRMREVIKMQIPKSIPRAPKGNPYLEWIEACKGGPACGSNFDYAGPLSEMVLLGVVAIRLRKRIEWDAANLRCPNAPEADALLRHPYRKF